MKFSRIIFWVAIVFLGALLLTTGCNSATKRKWLTTFFDGVPAETVAGSTAVTGAGTNSIASNIVVPPVKPVVKKMNFHKPFEDNKCSECHQSTFSQELRMPPPKLCFECHKDFLTGIKVKHQPVAEGDCKSCHDPQQSVNTNLLVKVGSALCLTCHDNPLAAGKMVMAPQH